MSQAKAKGKLRDPPPSLFLHPSPAASHVSLPGILAPGGPPPLSAGANILATQAAATAASPSGQRRDSLHGGGGGGGDSVVSSALRRTTRNLRTADSSRTVDRTDALWAEMQATLEEVELSASGGTRVFGPEHDRKLSGLRAAQISLAQAWARSEADDAIETTTKGIATGAWAGTGDEVRNLKGETNKAAGAAAAEGSEAANTTVAGGTNTAPRPASSGGGMGPEKLGARLEEETEVDIRLARKRREANDRYFHRVNQGVLDVVAKLGDVAVAMKAVEQETKDIWGENDSAPGSGKP